jgi:hypothetical protein
MILDISLTDKPYQDQATYINTVFKGKIFQYLKSNDDTVNWKLRLRLRPLKKFSKKLSNFSPYFQFLYVGSIIFFWQYFDRILLSKINI